MGESPCASQLALRPSILRMARSAPRHAFRQIWEYAFFAAASDPAEAQRVLDSFKDPSLEREEIRFYQFLFPSSNVVVVKSVLLAKMDGNEAEARKLLDDAEKLGIPLPGNAGAAAAKPDGAKP